MTAAYAPHKVNSLRPLKNTVLVADMIFRERKLNSGLILLNDNGTTAGIRPRWGRVYAVGSDQKDYAVGDWICVAHGRWTRGVEIEDAEGNTVTIRKVDPKDILLMSDKPQVDDTFSDAVQSRAQTR